MSRNQANVIIKLGKTFLLGGTDIYHSCLRRGEVLSGGISPDDDALLLGMMKNVSQEVYHLKPYRKKLGGPPKMTGRFGIIKKQTW